jgi:cytochrome P450
MIRRRVRNEDARVPPGPRGLAVAKFFGNGTFGGTLDFLTRQAREHGPIVMFEVLGRRMYLLDDPELLREVLVTQQHRFARATGAGILREIVGTSLITAEEPLHRTRRRMLQPAFHRGRMDAYGAVMTEESRAVAASIVADETLDIGALMTRLTLAVTGRTLFGADVGENAAAMCAALERAMRTVSRLGPVVEFLPAWADALRRRLPLRSNRELARARAELRAIVSGVVERRRHTRGGETDLLGLVLDARDDAGNGFDDDAVADELSTLLLAGHETTASALTWAWYLLARNPAAEAALHAELDAVLGERDPSPHDVPRLRYADAVFSEALRLYPPASAFGRRALETCRLGGYTIPRGSGIVISPYVSHRNERFFPEPERFSPERFLAGDGRETQRPEFAFVPFGGGARRCIGDGFARMEGVLALATLARRFRFEAVEAVPVGIASATLRPARPIRLRAVPRAVRVVCARAG